MILKRGTAKMKGRFSLIFKYKDINVEYKTIIISYLVPFYPAVFYLN
jgi:hypothetical protein